MSMRLMPFLTAFFVFMLIAAPAFAHHKPGHGGGPPGQRGGEESHNGDGPPSGPGNSGAAHWCKTHWAEEGFRNHGHCVSHHAHERNGGEAEAEAEGDGEGDLIITDIRIRTDGTFRLRGRGAEDLVIVSIGGGSGLVVGFGEAEPASDGTFTVEGEWACQENDSDHRARFRVRDSDETESQFATFPCDDLEP
jgi:hypothetical protein